MSPTRGSSEEIPPNTRESDASGNIELILPQTGTRTRNGYPGHFSPLDISRKGNNHCCQLFRMYAKTDLQLTTELFEVYLEACFLLSGRTNKIYGLYGSRPKPLILESSSAKSIFPIGLNL